MEHSDFVTQFYNLEGDLISERKKNFWKLLKAQPKPLTEDDLKNLTPTTYLENLFLIDIFIYFKLSTKLLEVIKGGNDVYISKILKHSSAIKEAIGSVSPESFVNDFLPCTSYAIRMKILKRICFFLDEQQMDEIVSCVEKRYGFCIAIKIVHTCSSNKIKDFFSKYEVVLKPRQIKFIFDKDPDLLVTYLNHYKLLKGNVYYHRNLCRYIASKNPTFWLQLLKDDMIRSSDLGRKTSKNLIRHSGSDFINNVEFYSKFLQLDVVARKLHGNFKEVYFNLFPREVCKVDTYNLSHRLLRKYPKKKQWDLFSQTYMKVFGDDILNNLIHLNSNFKDMFPNKTVLNKWAEEHYNKNKDNNSLKYCDPKQAIPLIKEKINVTSSVYDRHQLVVLLLENCAVNEDSTSLEAVLQYICFRHRNDGIASQILYQINSSFNLKELNENHWKCICELIALVRIKEQSMSDVTTKVALKYIEYLILHKKPFKEELVGIIKDISSKGWWFSMDLENPEIEKQIWTELFNIYPEIVEMNPDELRNWQENCIRRIIDFNAENPGYTIKLSDFPLFFTYVESILNKRFWEKSERVLLNKVINFNYKYPDKPLVTIEEAQVLEIFEHSKENFGFADAVEVIVKKKNRSKFENDVLQFFWGYLLKYSSVRCEIVPWLFVNEPRTIVPYIEKLFALDISCIDVAEIKLMSHLDLDKKVRDFLINKLEELDVLLEKVKNQTTSDNGGGDLKVSSEVKKDIKINVDLVVIEKLAVLLSTGEYIEIVATRLEPIKEKIDTTDEELNQIYLLQCEVAKSFRKVQEPVLALPAVMKFCIGDYLQSALPSLYSVCYRSPEHLLYSYMDLLAKRAVSARKHALFLSCELLSVDYAISKLQNVCEKNVSSQKHIFSATLKYFHKNPSDDLLNLVVENLNLIDKNDEETLKSLINAKMPKKYSILYIEKCWYFFEDLRKKEVEVQEYLQSLLSRILGSVYILESLPTDFCKHIIIEYYKNKNEKDHDLLHIHHFICKFLKHRKSEQTDNFKFVFDIIEFFKSSKNTTPIKCVINRFFSVALEGVKKNNRIDENNNYHIELFKQHWDKLFSPIDMFSERILLDILYLRYRSFNNFVEDYAKEVSIYLEELIAKYGPYVFDLFKKQVLYDHQFFDREKYIFLYNILKFKVSTLNCLLVLDLLEPPHRISDRENDIYDRIIEILKNSEDPVVRIFYNNYA